MNTDFYTHDPAFEILHPVDIDTATKADAWDAYHGANHRDLATNLAALNLPPEIHTALIEAKAAEIAAGKANQSSVDRTMEALNRLKTIPKNVLDLAEKFPHVAAHLVNAARDEEGL